MCQMKQILMGHYSARQSPIVLAAATAVRMHRSVAVPYNVQSMIVNGFRPNIMAACTGLKVIPIVGSLGTQPPNSLGTRTGIP